MTLDDAIRQADEAQKRLGLSIDSTVRQGGCPTSEMYGALDALRALLDQVKATERRNAAHALRDFGYETEERSMASDVHWVTGFLLGCGVRPDRIDEYAGKLLGAGWHRHAPTAPAPALEVPTDAPTDVREALEDLITDRRDEHPRDPHDMPSGELAEAILARFEVRGLPGPACQECRRTDGTHKMSCSARGSKRVRLSMRAVDGGSPTPYASRSTPWWADAKRPTTHESNGQEQER